MQYIPTNLLSNEQPSDCLIVPILAGKVLSDSAKQLDVAMKGKLSQIIDQELVSQLGKTVMVYEPMGVKAKRILCVYCGEEAELSIKSFKQLIASAAAIIQTQSIQSICCYLTDIPVGNYSMEWKIRMAIQHFAESAYAFEMFKTEKREATTLINISFYIDTDSTPVETAIKEGQAIVNGVQFTKDLANMPANYATPTKIAEHAIALAKEEANLQVQVFDRTDEVVQKMGAFLAVAQGSVEPPKFVVIHYKPENPIQQAPIALVGKGVTFDSGGISLKPSAKMEEMKFDMGGAASVLGTIKSIAQLKLPIPVVGILPLTENLPSGSAVKPGDVISTLSGQTVEVLNTDAEGRLILADALTYSRQFNPSVVIDIATLTGAMVVALGSIATGVITADVPLRNALEIAGHESGDRAWPLPLWDDYQDMIKSNIADMANLGEGGAGSITAACFLSRFTKGLCWAHLDIAGTAWHSGQNKTATGRPVPLLVQYIINYCNH